MTATLEPPPDELARLRGCLNDLVSVMALPALWADGEPLRIATTLADALLGMLRLAFVFVRLRDPDGGSPTDTLRTAESIDGTFPAREVGVAIHSALGDAPQDRSLPARMSIGGVDVSLTCARLGLNGDIGLVVGGSRRRDFPAGTDSLLLEVAANQAAIGLQHTRLLRAQIRLARELDERVAQRTRELAETNERLEAEVAERRRTEEALRERDRESRLIVDSIPGMVALLSATGDIEVVNPQMIEYFGQTVEDLRQWGTNDTVHPEDRRHVIEAFTRAISLGTPYQILQRFRRADGVYRWFANSGFPVRDANGRIVRWCVLLTDVDERKRAEDALRASERSLTLLIDTIPALAWSARPDGSAEFFNRLYLDFMGFSAAQAGDWGWTAAVHPDDLPELTAAWRHIMASEDAGEAEARLRRRDGEYRWFLFRMNPLRDEAGVIIKWYGVNTDIESRKRAQEELRRAYDSFAEAQRLSKTGSFISDLVEDDHTWSDEAFRIFEFDRESKITMQRIRAAIHADDLPSFESAIARGMTGVDVSLGFRIVTGRDAVKHVRGVAHVIEGAAGRPVFVGALQDVTESLVAEEALNRARGELAHVARVSTLSALTASIAHEVNQPLSGIVTNASTCLRMLDAAPPDVDGARETARRTIRDGNRASDVITRLRALYSKKDFALEPIDLNEAARGVIALSLSDLQRHRVALQSEFADGLPTISGDRIQLQQVILNLIRNASDAMTGVDDRPRRLLIRTEREEGDRVRLTVRDTGVGFPTQSQDELFDAFYTTKSDGMGIGLSVSRAIVERHHGRLWAEPNDGPGATFAFSIPSRPERTTEPPPVERPS